MFEYPCEQIDAPVLVRVSRRARYPGLTVSRRGLEVVLPRRYSRADVPGLLRDQHQWIATALDRGRRQFGEFTGLAAPEFPQDIELRACEATFGVRYQEHSTCPRLRVENEYLTLRGELSDAGKVFELLREFVREFAREALAEHVAELSSQTGLPYARITVRGQRTRWGSYSSRGTLSLNYKLMFLPPELYRHVLLHELCHARHHNHSARFWNLLRSFDEHCDAHDRALRRADHYIPAWVDHPA